MSEINKFDTNSLYTKNFGSNYPVSVMEQTHFKDVDDSVMTMVNTIKAKRASGDYAGAARDIATNINKLEEYFISATDINKLVEEIRNAQIFAIKKRKLVYVQSDEPLAEFEGDVWLDINNETENPEVNKELVVTRNKTVEDYEYEIQQLQNQIEALKKGN